MLIEDAAHAIASSFKGQLLGTFGQLSTFSFHETKNIICGEGGLLCINDPSLERRAEILWEKGTNRAEFFRGEVDKYTWVDTGSSFLPSDLVAAYLYAQLEKMEEIQTRRIAIWNCYYDAFKALEQQGKLKRPVIRQGAMVNGHLFYLVCSSEAERDRLCIYLKGSGILAPFHYIPLHSSPYFLKKHDGRELPHTDFYSRSLIRLPPLFRVERGRASRSH